MGPLVLLSILGIGAATAVVDVMGNNNDDAPDPADENETKPEPTPPTTMPIDVPGDPAPGGSPEGEAHHARGDETIRAGDGNDTLTGSGNAEVRGEGGNDAFRISGKVEGFGGDGEDYMHISEAARGFGGDGDDTFVLKASQDADGEGARADGGEGDDTFIMKPLSGLPEDTVPHVLTGGAGADVYALDIDAATSIRDGEDDGAPIVARITDFDPKEDMLLIDIGASANMPDLAEIPTPKITTTTDPDGAFTDVRISWQNPLNPDNIETRTVRLEGVTEFSADDVKLTSVFDPDSTHHDDRTDGAAAHKLFALKHLSATDSDDVLTVEENARIALQDGDDTLTLKGGSHLVDGGDGNDTITVSEESTGPVHLFGGEGDDVITADLVKNTDTAIFGGEGDDTITFGMGHYVDGNEGEDTFVLNVHADAVDQGPAVLRTLTGNHLTINIPPELEGEVRIVNHTYGNGGEVSYSEVFVGDVPVLKLLEEDIENGVGIAENDPRLTINRIAA